MYYRRYRSASFNGKFRPISGCTEECFPCATSFRCGSFLAGTNYVQQTSWQATMRTISTHRLPRDGATAAAATYRDEMVYFQPRHVGNVRKRLITALIFISRSNWVGPRPSTLFCVTSTQRRQTFFLYYPQQISSTWWRPIRLR
jgi:hypothetical protein